MQDCPHKHDELNVSATIFMKNFNQIFAILQKLELFIFLQFSVFVTYFYSSMISAESTRS